MSNIAILKGRITKTQIKLIPDLFANDGICGKFELYAHRINYSVQGISQTVIVVLHLPPSSLLKVLDDSR